MKLHLLLRVLLCKNVSDLLVYISYVLSLNVWSFAPPLLRLKLIIGLSARFLFYIFRRGWAVFVCDWNVVKYIFLFFVYNTVHVYLRNWVAMADATLSLLKVTVKWILFLDLISPTSNTTSNELMIRTTISCKLEQFDMNTPWNWTLFFFNAICLDWKLKMYVNSRFCQVLLRYIFSCELLKWSNWKELGQR